MSKRKGRVVIRTGRTRFVQDRSSWVMRLKAIANPERRLRSSRSRSAQPRKERRLARPRFGSVLDAVRLQRRVLRAALDGAYLLEDRAATRSFSSPRPAGGSPAPRRNQESPRQPAGGATQARRRVGVRTPTVEPTPADARPPTRAPKAETLLLSPGHGQWCVHWPQMSESVARSAGIPWSSRGI